MGASGQAITIKIAGDKPRTTGSGSAVKVIPGVSAERYVAFLEAPLRAELARLYPEASVTLRTAHAPSIELVGLKPVEEVRTLIGQLIGETLAEFGPGEG